MKNTDRLQMIRNGWAQRHKVTPPAPVVKEEAEPEAPEIDADVDESEAVDLDNIRGGSEEWAAGLAVYGD